MKIILDANILFAALIRDSATRRFLFFSKLSFIAPHFILEEVAEHWEEIMEKSGYASQELEELLLLHVANIEVISDKQLMYHKPEALRFMSEIDPDDAPYLACALAYPGSIIWSDDPDLKKQKIVKVMTTKEMISQSL